MITSLGKILRIIRMEKGLLLKDMADKMEVKSSYISSIENGKRKPTWLFVQKTCEALELDEIYKQKVEDAYYETVSEISISLDSNNPYQMDLGMVLARNFQKITPVQAEAIRNILKR